MPSLADVTRREIGLLTGFIAVLGEEQEALKFANVAVLPEIGVRKTELVEQLNALEIERGNALSLPNGENARTAMQHWLDAHPGELEIAKDWKSLLDLARKAKAMHELNGRLVGMHLQQTSELLAALTNQPPKNALLYGSDGQTSPVTGSRLVDSA